MPRPLTGLAVLLLAGCSVGAGGGGGDAPSQAIDATRATWQVLDLASGAVEPLGAIADPAAALYRDQRIAFRLLPAQDAAAGGAFARQDDETEAGRVGPVYIASLELTRAQWRRLAGGEPWRGLPGNAAEDDDLPALGLTPAAVAGALSAWNAAHDARLSLPSGAEWEAAARAGSAASYPWGEDHRTATVAAHAVTWETGLAAHGIAPRPVGGRLANALGLHDVCGNAWELVADGSARGGSWADALSLARPANRLVREIDLPTPVIGVRLAYRP